MRRIVAVLAAVALVALLGGAAFAGDFGMCSYGSHVNQAKTDKVEPSKTVASKTTKSPNTNQLLLAQGETMPKPAAKADK